MLSGPQKTMAMKRIPGWPTASILVPGCALPPEEPCYLCRGKSAVPQPDQGLGIADVWRGIPWDLSCAYTYMSTRCHAVEKEEHTAMK